MRIRLFVCFTKTTRRVNSDTLLERIRDPNGEGREAHGTQFLRILRVRFGPRVQGSPQEAEGTQVTCITKC